MGDADERRKSRMEMENLSLDTCRFSRNLLQRFMGTSGKSDQLEIAAREDINVDKLNLGLSLRGKFGVDKTSANLLVRSSSIAACFPTARDDDALASSSPQVTYNPSSLMRTSSLPVETEAEWRKRKELQRLRRMEAKRRRTEKVQRNIRGEKCIEDEKRGAEMNLRGKLEKEQFLATAKKFGCRLPTLAAFGADVAMPEGKGSYLVCKMQEKRKPALQGSMESQGGSSSSIISELESKPAQGSSEASPPSIHSLQRDSGSRTPGEEMEISPSNSVDATKSRVQETGTNALGDMPCVFTKGDGPNGRRIDGILYKYGKGARD